MSSSSVSQVTLINVNTNETLKIQYSNSQHRLQDAIHHPLPQSISQFYDMVYKHLKVSEKQVLQCLDSSGDPILKENFKNVSRVFVYLKDSGNNANGLNVTLEEDIIPHINILTKGGDEYDFISALAELIDNSIQNTVQNAKERTIFIDFNRKDSTVQITDTGKGMKTDEVKNWATMGVSDSPDMTSHLKRHSNHSMKSRKYITSDFSRYGVGSKRAIFNIGSKVTLCSKSASSPHVSQVSLDKRELNENQSWKARIIIRDPTKEEKKYSSFTTIIISDVNDLYTNEYQPEVVRKKLCHLYHYYIFGAMGNRVTSSQTQHADDSDDEDTPNGDCTPEIQIFVDGKSLAEVEDDIESQYLSKGRRKLTFTIPLQVENIDNRPIGTTQGPKTYLNSKVYGEIYYFPTEDGVETLPIPILKDHEISGGDQEVSLHDRNPGFEVFWNGRLLPRAHIRALKFMQDIKRGRDLPATCLSRVKGMLFVDSTFVVSATKLDLKREGFPLYTALMQYDDRKLRKTFTNWLVECHKDLDMEIKFLEHDHERNSTDGRFYYYKVVEFRGEKICLGDRVKLAGRPTVYGTITGIYREAGSDFSYTCFLTIEEAEKQIEETHAISMLKETLSEKKYKQVLDQIKQKHLHKLKVVKTPKVAANQQQLPDTADAGFQFDYITVAIHDGNDKPVAIKNAQISMVVKYKSSQKSTEREIHRKVATQPYKGALYCFKLNSKKETFVDFEKAGTYTFEFSTDLQDVKAIKSKINILPLSPHRLIISPNNPIKSQIGEEFDVKLLFVDKYSNRVQIPKEFDKSKLQIAFQDTAEASIVLDTDSIELQSDKKSVLVKNLQISSGTTSEEDPAPFEIAFTYDSLESALLKGTVFPGAPHQLVLSEDTKRLCAMGTESPIPQIALYLVDSSNNRLNISASECVLSSSSLDKHYHSSPHQRTGIYTYDELMVLGCPERAEFTASVHIDNEKLVDEVDFSVPIHEQTLPPTSGILHYNEDANIQLIVRDNMRLSIRGPREYCLSGARFMILDSHGTHMEELSGVCTIQDKVNGDEIIFQQDFQNGCVMLENIDFPEDETGMCWLVDIGPSKEKKWFSYEFSISSFRQPPAGFSFVECPQEVACGVPFSVKVEVVDEGGTRFEPGTDDYKRYESILSKVDPQIDVRSPITQDIEWETLELKEDWTVTLDDEGCYTISNIVVLGFPARFPFNLRLKDSSGKLESSHTHIDLKPGPVVESRLDKQKRIQREVQNFGRIAAMELSGHDICGNLTPFSSESQVIMDQIEGDLEMFSCQDDNSSSISLTQKDDGTMFIPSIFVKGIVGKSYTLQLYTDELAGRISSYLDITLLPSNVPARIEVVTGIEDSKTKTLTAGTALGPFSVRLIGEDGEVSRGHYAVDMKVILPGESVQTFVGQLSEEYDGVYDFKQSRLKLERSGSLSIRFKVDFRGSANPCVKLLQPLLESVNRNVLHGEADALRFIPDITSPTISNDPDEDLKSRTLFETVAIQVVDEYGNRCTNVDGGLVSLNTYCSDQDEVPRLNGSLTATMMNGEAHFNSSVSVVPNSAPAGRYYSLVATYDYEGTQLEVSTDFLYADMRKQKARIEKLESDMTKIAQKKNEINKEIRKLEDLKETAHNKHQKLEDRRKFLAKQMEQQYGRSLNECQDVKTLQDIREEYQRLLMSADSDPHRRGDRGKLNEECEYILKLREKNPRNGIIGLLIDLAFVDKEAVDAVVCRQLKNYLHTIVVETDDVSQKVSKKLKAFGTRHSVHILSLERMAHHYKSVPLTADGRVDFKAEEENFFKRFPGYLGPLVNCIEIPDSSKLRLVFYSLLGQTRLFDTEENARAAQKHFKEKSLKIDLLTLDHTCLKATGMVTVEPNKGVITETRRFGSPPVNRHKEELKEAVDRFQELIDATIESLRVYEEDVVTTNKECDALIKNLKQQLRDVSNEMAEKKKTKMNLCDENIQVSSQQVNAPVHSTTSKKRKAKKDISTAPKKKQRKQREPSPDIDAFDFNEGSSVHTDDSDNEEERRRPTKKRRTK